MNHRKKQNALNLKSSHRRALIKNMVTSLFQHERITTTLARAKAVRPYAEKLITKSKTDSVHNRRIVRRMIENKSILGKLFSVLGPRFNQRPGGYTRILKLGPRAGDAAERVLFELVERTETDSSKQSKTAKKEEKAEKKAETKSP